MSIVDFYCPPSRYALCSMRYARKPAPHSPQRASRNPLSDSRIPNSEFR